MECANNYIPSYLDSSREVSAHTASHRANVHKICIQAFWDGVQGSAVKVNVTIEIDAQPGARYFILNTLNKHVQSAAVVKLQRVQLDVDGDASGDLGIAAYGGTAAAQTPAMGVDLPEDVDQVHYVPISGRSVSDATVQILLSPQSEHGSLQSESVQPISSGEMFYNRSVAASTDTMLDDDIELAGYQRLQHRRSLPSFLENTYHTTNGRRPSPILETLREDSPPFHHQNDPMRTNRTRRRQRTPWLPPSLEDFSPKCLANPNLTRRALLPVRKDSLRNFRSRSVECLNRSSPNSSPAEWPAANTIDIRGRHIYRGNFTPTATTREYDRPPNNGEGAGSSTEISVPQDCSWSTYHSRRVSSSPATSPCVWLRHHSQPRQRVFGKSRIPRSDPSPQFPEMYSEPVAGELHGRLYIDFARDVEPGAYTVGIEATMLLTTPDTQNWQTLVIPGVEDLASSNGVGSFKFYMQKPPGTTDKPSDLQFRVEHLMDGHSTDHSVGGDFDFKNMPLLSMRQKQDIYFLEEYNTIVLITCFPKATPGGVEIRYHIVLRFEFPDMNPPFADAVKQTMIIRNVPLQALLYQLDPGVREVSLENADSFDLIKGDTEIAIGFIRQVEDMFSTLHLHFQVSYDLSDKAIALPTFLSTSGRILSELVLVEYPRLPLQMKHLPGNSATWQAHADPDTWMRFQRLSTPTCLIAGFEDDLLISFAKLEPVTFSDLLTINQCMTSEKVAWELSMEVFEQLRHQTMCRMDVNVFVGEAPILLRIDQGPDWCLNHSFMNRLPCIQPNGQWYIGQDGCYMLIKSENMNVGEKVHISVTFQRRCWSQEGDILLDDGKASQVAQSQQSSWKLPKIMGKYILRGSIECSMQHFSISITDPSSDLGSPNTTTLTQGGKVHLQSLSPAYEIEACFHQVGDDKPVPMAPLKPASKSMLEFERNVSHEAQVDSPLDATPPKIAAKASPETETKPTIHIPNEKQIFFMSWRQRILISMIAATFWRFYEAGTRPRDYLLQDGTSELQSLQQFPSSQGFSEELESREGAPDIEGVQARELMPLSPISDLGPEVESLSPEDEIGGEAEAETGAEAGVGVLDWIDRALGWRG